MKKIRVYIIITIFSLLVFQMLLVLCSCNTSKEKRQEQTYQTFQTNEQGIRVENGDLPIMTEN